MYIQLFAFLSIIIYLFIPVESTPFASYCCLLKEEYSRKKT